jgi:hypothetical protein
MAPRDGKNSVFRRGGASRFQGDGEADKRRSDAELVLGTKDASLLDIVDNVLNKGVVLSGDITIGLAQVDLIYAQLSLLLCAADRVLPREDADFETRREGRREQRRARRRQPA